MRPRFQADEDFNVKIIAGLLRREPSLNIQTAKAAGVLGLCDPQVLSSAARDGRILVSHDRDTMPSYFRRARSSILRNSRATWPSPCGCRIMTAYLTTARITISIWIRRRRSSALFRGIWTALSGSLE